MDKKQDSTITESMAQMDDNCIKEALLSRLSSSSAVVVQADSGWKNALKRWTGYRGQTPAAVVHPVNDNDVIETVSWKKKRKKEKKKIIIISLLIWVCFK